MGSDGYDAQWECKTDMSNKYRFGRIDVNCEGYDYPNDPYVLRGSCGVSCLFSFNIYKQFINTIYWIIHWFADAHICKYLVDIYAKHFYWLNSSILLYHTIVILVRLWKKRLQSICIRILFEVNRKNTFVIFKFFCINIVTSKLLNFSILLFDHS